MSYSYEKLEEQLREEKQKDDELRHKAFISTIFFGLLLLIFLSFYLTTPKQLNQYTIYVKKDGNISLHLYESTKTKEELTKDFYRQLMYENRLVIQNGNVIYSIENIQALEVEDN